MMQTGLLKASGRGCQELMMMVTSYWLEENVLEWTTVHQHALLESEVDKSA